ncbi:RCC1 domain-containing protein, partial [Lujinxingia litoralis]|uniref:RCC1 domain-containing protein n=1 Tax=Lujinxingia litoralis TaxID=2211119 RepID=UPI0018F7ADC4
QVSAGGQHTCGVKEDGSLWCWGYNTAGQVISASGSASSYNTPQDVSEGLSWLQVATGSTHTCGITSDEALYCWGLSIDGQLGTGTPVDDRTRVEITSGGTTIDTFVAVAAGDAHTCAVTAQGANGWCWGSPGDGRLDGDPGASSGPVKVQGAPGVSSSTTSIIAAGGSHSCAMVDVGSENRTYCWGNGDSGQNGHNSEPDVAQVNGFTFSQITAGKEHTCAIADEVAYCWGRASEGRLGHNQNTNTSPTEVNSELNGWSGIAAGGEHSCGIADNVMYCWGRNNAGQLGHPGSGATPTPVAWPYSP